jgi:hypothetical protein
LLPKPVAETAIGRGKKSAVSASAKKKLASAKINTAIIASSMREVWRKNPTEKKGQRGDKYFID